MVPLINDPVDDVQWNTALSLARLGSDQGADILMKMLDREYLRNAQQLNDTQIEPVMVNAARGFTYIRKQEIVPALEKISKQDPSLKVRQAALAALEYQHK